MGLGLRPGAKAPDQPPMPYRLRASPRLYHAVAAAAVAHGERRLAGLPGLAPAYSVSGVNRQ